MVCPGYNTIRKLGEGGFGVFYLAQRESDRQVGKSPTATSEDVHAHRKIALVGATDLQGSSVIDHPFPPPRNIEFKELL
jgi:serine/threonine protein kinase